MKFSSAEGNGPLELQAYMDAVTLLDRGEIYAPLLTPEQNILSEVASNQEDSREIWFVADPGELDRHASMLEKISLALGCAQDAQMLSDSGDSKAQQRKLLPPRAVLLFGHARLMQWHGMEESLCSFFVLSGSGSPCLYLPNPSAMVTTPELKLRAWKAMQGFMTFLEKARPL